MGRRSCGSPAAGAAGVAGCATDAPGVLANRARAKRATRPRRVITLPPMERTQALDGRTRYPFGLPFRRRGIPRRGREVTGRSRRSARQRSRGDTSTRRARRDPGSRRRRRPRPLTVSITSRAMPSRRAGHPQLRPSRPCVRANIVAHVGRTVHHDRALVGAIVEARIETVQAQRVAVAANVGVVGAKQAEARLVALGSRSRTTWRGCRRCRGRARRAPRRAARASAGRTPTAASWWRGVSSRSPSAWQGLAPSPDRTAQAAAPSARSKIGRVQRPECPPTPTPPPTTSPSRRAPAVPDEWPAKRTRPRGR